MTDIYKHTLGPWHTGVWTYADKKGTKRIQIFANEDVVAEIHDLHPLRPGEAQANADLMTAAPDMYEALLSIANYDPTRLDAATLGNIARSAVYKVADDA